MKLAPFIRECENRLAALYPVQEAGRMALLLFMDRLGIRPYSPVTDPECEIGEEAVNGIAADMLRLMEGEPLQYVLGHASFYGREFNVSPSVLIPRPETEELVEAALGLPWTRAIDLCTGSGCIAWSLKLERPDAEVIGVDVSKEALDVASHQPFSPSPLFLERDILLPPDVEGKFDLLTANPPYIMESEKTLMRKNVLSYEPSLALFVPSSDPLLFYRAVGEWASALLVPGGNAIVEINERFGRETSGLFSGMGMEEVRTVRDIGGKDRFVSFRKP